MARFIVKPPGSCWRPRSHVSEAPRLRAADDPAEQVLKKHGLRIVGSLALAETEAPIKSKLTEARRIAQQIRLVADASRAAP